MNSMFYNRSADEWDEALPLGNGRIGAMVYGRVEEEIIQLNEESLWNGKKRSRINPDSKKYLNKIRDYIAEGDIENAQRMSLYALSGTPQYQSCYQTLGELKITHHNKPGKINDYCRKLNLDDAVCTVEYHAEEGGFYQEAFISYPSDCMVISMKTTGKRTLDFSCRLDRGRYFDRAYAENGQTIAFEGNIGGIGFIGMLTAKECDGEVETIGEHLIIKAAHQVTLVFSAATDFNHKSPKDFVLHIIREALGKDIQELRMAHIDDYHRLFNRMTLSLPGDAKLEKLPVNLRLENLRNGIDDPALLACYFQYGRYLMISSSRKNGLPANLQGIWNEDFTPPWDSKYTININLQMNYWFVDMCNLSECYEPFFALLKRVKDSGTVTAKTMYGCRGFVAHHNTDIYADTAPQDQYVPATYWVMGGAWLALHIWEHYEYTKDRGFLEDNYEVLNDAVQFFADFLIQDKNGNYVTSPSVSPENTYIMENGKKGCLCAGPAMDCMILSDLFRSYLSASQVLGIHSELTEQAEKILKRLPGPKIGSYGQIMEWQEDYKEAEPGHRHISQLFGVYPSSQINYEDTPELMKAAEVTLERRLQHGGGHTGWSRAWIILLWARFGKGDYAYDNLKRLLSDSTFDNFMDNHPYDCRRGKVFQIDGNFGAAAGIAEMLVQSQNGIIRLLPALPKKLHTGSITGICVHGHGEIDLEWKKGALCFARIRMCHDGEYKIRYKTAEKLFSFRKDHVYTLDSNLNIL